MRSRLTIATITILACLAINTRLEAQHARRPEADEAVTVRQLNSVRAEARRNLNTVKKDLTSEVHEIDKKSETRAKQLSTSQVALEKKTNDRLTRIEKLVREESQSTRNYVVVFSSIITLILTTILGVLIYMNTKKVRITNPELEQIKAFYYAQGQKPVYCRFVLNADPGKGKFANADFFIKNGDPRVLFKASENQNLEEDVEVAWSARLNMTEQIVLGTVGKPRSQRTARAISPTA